MPFIPLAKARGFLASFGNTFYGEPQKFELFNGSKTKIEAEKRGATIDLPDLADRVTDDLYSKRLSIVTALETMPLGNKAELKRWRSVAWKMFDDIGIAQPLPAREEKILRKVSGLNHG